jgi:hypothetical protein
VHADQRVPDGQRPAGPALEVVRVDPGQGVELDLAAARRLRDALRRLAADVTGDSRPSAATGLGETDAVRVVNAALPRPRLRYVESGDDAEFGAALAAFGDELAVARREYLASRAATDALVGELA